MLAALGEDQALFFRALADRLGATDTDVTAAVWELVWAGLVTNDTLAPIRSLLGSGGRTAHCAPAAYPACPVRAVRRARRTGVVRSAPHRLRWPVVGRPPPPATRTSTRRAVAAADALLDRYGLVTRGAAVGERIAGGFAAVYPVLKAAEESGRARRGYFVEGLGAAQFALPGAVDRLRSQARPLDVRDPSPALVLAATDPANPYGAALPWPPAAVPPTPVASGTDAGAGTAGAGTSGAPTAGRGHQPGRKAGALVVTVDGACVLYVERGGRTLLSFTDDPACLQPAADALALAVRDGALGKMQVERADGQADQLLAAGDGAGGGGLPAHPSWPASARLTGGRTCPRETPSGSPRTAWTWRCADAS